MLDSGNSGRYSYLFFKKNLGNTGDTHRIDYSINGHSHNLNQ